MSAHCHEAASSECGRKTTLRKRGIGERSLLAQRHEERCIERVFFGGLDGVDAFDNRDAFVCGAFFSPQRHSAQAPKIALCEAIVGCRSVELQTVCRGIVVCNSRVIPNAGACRVTVIVKGPLARRPSKFEQIRFPSTCERVDLALTAIRIVDTTRKRVAA